MKITLRNKTILITFTTLILLLFSFLAVSHTLILSEFKTLQDSEVLKNLFSLLKIINKKFQNLDTIVHDWSSWDDTYSFVLNNDADYIKSNLGLETFNNLNINFMIFIDKNQNIIFKNFYDKNSKKFVEFPSEILKIFQFNNSLLDINNLTSNYGILKFSNKPIIFCLRQILKSDESGPAAGILIMGYYLDSYEIEDISKTIGIDTKLLATNTLPTNAQLLATDQLPSTDQHPSTDKNSSAYQQPLTDQSLNLLLVKQRQNEIIQQGEIKKDVSFYINYENHQTVKGYLTIKDFFGRDSLTFEISMPATIYIQGYKTIYYILAFSGFPLLVIVILFILYIDKLILVRINRLASQTRNIGLTSDTSKRVLVSGNDEISVLEKEINTMLESLDKQKKTFEYLASHDSLTGLYNRKRFEEELDKAIFKAARNKNSYIILLDIDNFKLINDTYSHTIGDKILIFISKHIKSNCRNEDTIARFSGDEFAILFEAENIKQAKNVASRLQEKIKELKINMQDININENIQNTKNIKTFNNSNINFTASIGLVKVEKTSTKEVLIANASKAMIKAKESGGNKIILFEPNKDYYTEKYKLLNIIKDAIQRKNLVLLLQPIIDLKSNSIVYYEALLRLIVSNDDYLSSLNKTNITVHTNALATQKKIDKKVNKIKNIIIPENFIYLAENFGLINDITYWVIKEAIKILKTNDINCIFINLSSKSLLEDEFLKKIRNIIINSKINPERIGFEITESLIFDVGGIVQGIKFIKELGCKFAIDDFGAGFSSYSALSTLPIDYLKIDGNLIKDVTQDNRKYAVVKAIKYLADLLDKKTVAEWVESQEIAKTIKELGLDFAQGFYFGHPKAVNFEK